MRLVIGRGKRRQVFDLPCADILNRADAVQRQQLISNVSAMLGLDPQPAAA